VYYTIVFFFLIGHVRTKNFCVKEKYGTFLGPRCCILLTSFSDLFKKINTNRREYIEMKIFLSFFGS
jgi:hypothetical protein